MGRQRKVKAAADARLTLGRLDGIRLRFRARLERWGEKPAFKGYPIRTLLLVDLTRADTGEVVADHLWFTSGKWAEGLSVGCTFEFDARVDSYRKGYRGYRDDEYLPGESLDWHLERPTKVTLIRRYPETAGQPE